VEGLDHGSVRPGGPVGDVSGTVGPVDRQHRHLGTATWTDVAHGLAPVVAIPIGSCEQHGPHLPLATDTIVAEALAARLADRRDDVVVGPTIAVSASGEHQGFAGTLSIGNRVTAALVVELVRSADWAAGVVLVNGHGGNRTAVDSAVSTLTGEGRRVAAWWPTGEPGDLHAGAAETSMMLALRPDLVRVADAEPGPVPALAELIAHGVRRLSPSGVLGDPTGASAASGAVLLDAHVADLARAVHATAARWRASVER
jgi:mycofactocin system creatininase family protein